jgi:hypothetical protein
MTGVGRNRTGSYRATISKSSHSFMQRQPTRLPGGANIWVDGTSLFPSAPGGLAGYNSSLGGPLTGVDIWWARWLYDGFDVDGILYLSRLTGAECVAVYDWTLASKLRATRVADLTALADLPPATAVTERQASLVAWHSAAENRNRGTEII